MSRITQRPRQIDINKPIIKYDNFEEFSKLDTTYEAPDQQISNEKVNLAVINENVSSSSANKKKDQVIFLSKDKKGKGDSIVLALHKQDILIPEAKKLEEDLKNSGN